MEIIFPEHLRVFTESTKHVPGFVGENNLDEKSVLADNALRFVCDDYAYLDIKNLCLVRIYNDDIISANMAAKPVLAIVSNNRILYGQSNKRFRIQPGGWIGCGSLSSFSRVMTRN